MDSLFKDFRKSANTLIFSSFRGSAATREQVRANWWNESGAVGPEAATGRFSVFRVSFSVSASRRPWDDPRLSADFGLWTVDSGLCSDFGLWTLDFGLSSGSANRNCSFSLSACAL